MPADPIAEAIAAIADGASIDWRALGAGAGSDAERDGLKWLQVVADIADLHRSPKAQIENASTVAAPTHERVDRTTEFSDSWGRYRLVEKVGKGSFGNVYKAWDPDLQRDLAIKILHRRVDDVQLKDQLLQEGRALAQIKHDNVVHVFGVESEGDRVALCMEFIVGETLDSLLQTNGVLSDREAALVGEDVCRALVAVHKQGFVHQDVKARNVMRQRAGRTKLMDFGTGRRLEPGEGVEPFERVGTPIYMAPEVLAGEPPSVQSDIYSVGVLLFHLVTGDYPVVGNRLQDLLAAHSTGRRRSLTDLRPDLGAPFIEIVKRALAPNPSDRWPTAGALLEALAGLNARPASVPRPKVWTWVTGAVALGLGFTVLGVVSSRYFNLTLGRGRFANEGVWDWLRWGAQSLLAPTVLLLMGMVSVAVATVAIRLILQASPRASRLKNFAIAVVRRTRLDDVTTMASCALLITVLLVGGAVWMFSPLLSAITSVGDISSAPLENLQYFSPHFYGYHENYRIAFTWVTIACAFVWYLVLKRSRANGQPIARDLLAGGIAVAVLSLLFLQFPYRVIWHSEFEVTKWRGATCYILGSRGDEHLLFCPQLPPPRNKIVKQQSPEIEHVGAIENIFVNIPITDKDWP